MKLLCYTKIILMLAICSCANKENEISKRSLYTIDFNIQDNERINTKILSTVTDYLDTINKERKDSLKVCRLFIEQRNAEVVFKISSVIYYSSVLEDMPQGYLQFDDKLVLIYTGIERLYHKPEAIPENLSDELQGRMINNLMPDLKTVVPTFRPGLFSYPTWEVHFQNDSLVVNRNAEPVSRVKSVIYQLPSDIMRE